jgi:tryptophan-rich sensory protein
MLHPAIHVLLPVLAACILNGYIYLMGWNSTKSENPLLPPGYVIGIVWIIILALLGYAHYLVYPSYSSWVIVAAIVYCLMYPFLTNGLKDRMMYLFNGIALIFAILVFATCYSTVVESAVYTVPFLLWSVYVNIVTIAYAFGFV